MHEIPESSDWALAVQTLGGIASYREILKLREPKMSRKLKSALDAARDAMRRSLELANATMVDRKLDNGITIRTACCFGYSSEVAARLYEGQHRTVVALFDLRSQGVSLRRSADCDVDLSSLAESFGGGGHAAASGFAIPISDACLPSGSPRFWAIGSRRPRPKFDFQRQIVPCLKFVEAIKSTDWTFR